MILLYGITKRVFIRQVSKTAINNMKTGKTIGVIGGLILGIITIFISNPFGIFDFPDAIGVSYSDTNSMCQKFLDFNNADAGFSFTYQNQGKSNGIFIGSIDSTDVLSKYKNTNQQFSAQSYKDWFAEMGGKSIPFEFSLKIPNSTEPPETISIDISLTCNKKITDNFTIPCGNKSFTCNYQNKHVEHFGPDYELIN